MSRRAALLAAVLLAAGAAGLSGQGTDESRLLREAAALEARADFSGAEALLRRVLASAPTSSGALFALERVLRAKGEPRALLPVTDTFLAHDPTASGARHLKLRVLVEVDSLDGLEAEAERWLGALPASEMAYREVARVYERAFGPERALEVLRRGRGATGQPTALALEIGDLLASTGHSAAAVEEWGRAVGPDGAQATVVARRVAGLPEDPQGAARALVHLLAGAPETGRRQAAVQIALDAGLSPEALELVRRVLPSLEERARMPFLADVARRAREGGVDEVAAWAYGELGEGAGTPAERRDFEERLVEMSLAAGDTARALGAQRRVVDSFTPGSADRRRATALLLQLEGTHATAEELGSRLRSFESEFPQAPELDRLAALAARTLWARGDREAAESVLEGRAGPLCELERGFLLLDAGALGEARASLLAGLGGLEPADATPVIQLATLLGRVSDGGGRALARAAVQARQGRGADAAPLLAAAADSVVEEDRPPLLAHAARLADGAGDAEGGAAIRRRLLEEHPDAPEAQEAALALARHAARTPGGRGDAVRILEGLVARWPGSAVAPDARRELERLGRSR